MRDDGGARDHNRSRARAKLVEDAARYKSTQAPAIIGHVLGRIDTLAKPARASTPTKIAASKPATKATKPARTTKGTNAKPKKTR